MGRKGFTVIELMIVIATIAVLAAILLPKVTSMVEKRKTARLYDEVSKVSMALTQFYKDCGTYPKDNAVGLLWNKSWATASNVQSGVDPSTCWHGPYIDTLPPNQLSYFDSPFGSNATCTIVTNGGDINGNGNTTDIYVQCKNIPQTAADLLDAKIDGGATNFKSGDLLAQCQNDICTIEIITDEF